MPPGGCGLPPERPLAYVRTVIIGKDREVTSRFVRSAVRGGPFVTRRALTAPFRDEAAAMRRLDIPIGRKSILQSFSVIEKYV